MVLFLLAVKYVAWKRISTFSKERLSQSLILRIYLKFLRDIVPRLKPKSVAKLHKHVVYQQTTILAKLKTDMKRNKQKI